MRIDELPWEVEGIGGIRIVTDISGFFKSLTLSYFSCKNHP